MRAIVHKKKRVSIIIAAFLLMFLSLTITKPIITSLSPRSVQYNPFGIVGSGLGRTFCRLLTDQANTAFHYGIPEPSHSATPTALSEFMEKMNSSCIPIARRSPPNNAETLAALRRAEYLLKTAFDLDPSYYPAYEIYFFFLTENPRKADGDAWRGAESYRSDLQSDTAGLSIGRSEHQGRLLKALLITHKALASYRLDDPEQSVDAALAVYNQYSLLAPQDRSKNKDDSLRLKKKAAAEMAVLLDNAREKLKQKQWDHEWERSPSRKADYAKDYRFASRLRAVLIDSMRSAPSGSGTQIDEKMKEPLPKESKGR